MHSSIVHDLEIDGSTWSVHAPIALFPGISPRPFIAQETVWTVEPVWIRQGRTYLVILRAEPGTFQSVVRLYTN
jgi:hypothetical protein